MKVLIIGSGGREHALAWKVAQDPRVEKVFVAPGNAGTAIEAKCENVAIDVTALEQLADFAEKNVDLTIVGPEAPLVIGVVDLFRSRGLDCFGPTKGAAQLEGSKAFTKDFLARHKIPTADYQNFTEIEPALAYLKEKGAPIVIKADGLAAGKGVIVAMTLQEAEDAVRDMLAGNAFGDAGSRVVIEESSTARKPASSSWSTAITCCQWPPARTTSASATRTPARTPAAWAPTPLRQWSPWTCTSA